MEADGGRTDDTVTAGSVRLAGTPCPQPRHWAGANLRQSFGERVQRPKDANALKPSQGEPSRLLHCNRRRQIERRVPHSPLGGGRLRAHRTDKPVACAPMLASSTQRVTDIGSFGSARSNKHNPRTLRLSPRRGPRALRRHHAGVDIIAGSTALSRYDTCHPMKATMSRNSCHESGQAGRAVQSTGLVTAPARGAACATEDALRSSLTAVCACNTPDIENTWAASLPAASLTGLVPPRNSGGPKRDTPIAKAGRSTRQIFLRAARATVFSISIDRTRRQAKKASRFSSISAHIKTLLA